MGGSYTLLLRVLRLLSSTAVSGVGGGVCNKGMLYAGEDNSARFFKQEPMAMQVTEFGVLILKYRTFIVENLSKESKFAPT